MVDSSYDYVYKVAGFLGRPELIVVNVLLNSTNILMEIDTSATCTLIPKSQYKLIQPIFSKRPNLIYLMLH